jgi:protein-tyrosine-phosphatase
MQAVNSDALPHVVFLCTGNAARSVMAGVMLENRGAAVHITTAGTHVLEHQPISVRTRLALRSVGLEAPEHRSHQLTWRDVLNADLVVAMAAEHVWYVRRRHPDAAARTATLHYLSHCLPPGPVPLAARIDALRLAHVDPSHQGDVTDPAGGDDVDYLVCARELSLLVADFAPRLV